MDGGIPFDHATKKSVLILPCTCFKIVIVISCMSHLGTR